MPDRQHHRGPHPQDRRLFLDPRRLRRLQAAAGDHAWLLGRGYAPEAALKLVGDHYQLPLRQRIALRRAVAAPLAAELRRGKRIQATELEHQPLQVDAFNQLITVEAALAGGILLRGHDGALRDLASVHGRYRKVDETARALELIGIRLEALRPSAVSFLIDRMVSNSGQLASSMRELAERRSWRWSAEPVPSADPILKRSVHAVATSDSTILDAAAAWFDLAAATIETLVAGATILDLDTPPPLATTAPERGMRRR
jgi:hypothetical protein